MEGLKPPIVPEAPVPVLSDDQLTALLKAAAAHPDRFTARRDEAILRTLLDTGIRISELVGMTTAETDLDQAVAWVTGKGSRRRVVVLSPKTVRALDRYLKVRGQHRHAIEAALWLSQRGPMTKDGADDRLRVIAAAAGVEGVHAHRFRHSWAHDWLAAGGSERDIMRLAGWRTATMLDRYGASMADVRAREAAARMRRGDRL
jgi:site-specific recombinase XerD